MSKLTPHIRVSDGKCEEAMNFYKSVFGGTLEIVRVKDSPMAKDMPGKENLIMHAGLTGGDFYLSGSDMMRDPVTVGDNVSIMAEGKSEKQVDDLFAKISKGGEVFMKPEKQFWGGYFGMVTDKYGVEWSFHFQMEPMKKA